MIKISYVELPANDEPPARGFLAEPGTPGQYPGVILIHGIWGLVDQVKGLCRRLATKYYIALAPDLFLGKTAATPEEGQSRYREVPQSRMLATLNAAYQCLANKPNATGKVGTVGYGLGGTLSLQWAIQNPRLNAAVVYYGSNPEPLDKVAKIQCPLLGNYGGEDESVSPSVVHDLEESLRRHGKQFNIKIYPRAPHGFANETRSEYRHLETINTWIRMMDFLRNNLKEGTT